MSGVASFGGALSPGAGRTVDLTWPDALCGPYVQEAAAVGVGPGYVGRAAFNNPANLLNTSSQTVFGGASSALYRQNYFGRAFINLVGAPAVDGNGVLYNLDAMTMVPNLGDAAVNQGDYGALEDFACYRSFVPLAFASPQAGYLNDIGVEWVCATNPSGHGIKANVVRGFGFSMTADDTVSWLVYSGAVVATPVVVGAATIAKWHLYEVRLIGSTAQSHAKLLALIDGKRVATVDAVSGLSYPSDGTVIGFKTVIVNRGGGWLGVGRVRFMAGPTEASLL